MAIDYHRLKQWQFPEVRQSYTEKDCMLYALGLGMGSDPLDPGALQFVYEKGLKAMPTMAAVLGYPGFWMQNPETGIDWKQLLHGEQRVRLHRPLPVAASIVGRTVVQSVTDKGAAKGAIVVVERTITDAASGALLASIEMVTFCRGDGGYSANGQPSDPLGAALPATPELATDAVCDLPTRPEAALIYRLSGDPNPLHADPAIAAAAGFERPILHGLATFGIAAHAILKVCCGYQPEKLKALSVRFTAPVYPGETIRTEMWRQGETIAFRARAVERDRIVLSNGVAELHR
jgi:acyl dehydratase